MVFTSGVAWSTSTSILSYGNRPICSPERFVVKFTQKAFDRGVPKRRRRFVSSPNCLHISSDRGDRACALGADSRVAYRSIINDFTTLLSAIIQDGSSCSASILLFKRDKRYASRSPQGPPPTINTGTSVLISGWMPFLTAGVEAIFNVRYHEVRVNQRASDKINVWIRGWFILSDARHRENSTLGTFRKRPWYCSKKGKPQTWYRVLAPQFIITENGQSC